MTKCITHNESSRFISHMVKYKINIVASPFLNAHSSLGNRQKLQMCKNIVGDLLKPASYPIFYVMNLIVTDDCKKHSMLLSLDEKQWRVYP